MPDPRSTRILIADDCEETRYVLSRVLSAAGYECLEVQSGSEALGLAQTLPDLLILDVRLPDISGYEVCKRIKQNPKTASISVLQISASFVNNGDRVRALEGGADGYLTHPIDAMVLVATVGSLVRLRNAEAHARKAAMEWQATFDALNEGIALVDPEGRLARWNAAFQRFCSCDPVLEQGRDAAPLLESMIGTSEPLRKGESRFSADFQMGRRTVQVSVNPAGGPGAEEEKTLILTDVTDRILAEYAVRTAEKLAVTGRLASTIAHEINNPLEALVNLIYLAKRVPSMDEALRLLSSADRELERIARITKQSLAFHRDSEKPIDVDLSQLVTEVVTLYEGSAAAHHVRLICDCRPAPVIAGFPGQLTQVFGNLIRNAAEAAPPATEVVVRVRSICRKGHMGTRVTIHDHGCGIPPDLQTRMFDPFFTTKALKGSGLGLWVSKSLVSRHSGTIRFRSSQRVGASGTTFEVFFPVSNCVRLEDAGGAPGLEAKAAAAD